MLCNTDIVCIELDLVKDFDDDMVTDLSMVKNFTRTLNRSLDSLYTPVINKTIPAILSKGKIKLKKEAIIPIIILIIAFLFIFSPPLIHPLSLNIIS